MNPLRRTEADETSTLAMENELLRYEVVHLRARIAAVESERDKAEREKAKLESGDAVVDPDAPDAARDDLVWLLGRIEATPASVVLKRREGYRRLVATYLNEGGA